MNLRSLCEDIFSFRNKLIRLTADKSLIRYQKIVKYLQSYIYLMNLKIKQL